MAGLEHGSEDIQRVLESIDLTYERAANEGFDGPDEGLETLKEFCETLLNGGDISYFLSNQDMVIPGE
jgi:hypothetical protein